MFSLLTLCHLLPVILQCTNELGITAILLIWNQVEFHLRHNSHTLNSEHSQSENIFFIPHSIDCLQLKKCKLSKFSLSIRGEQHLNILRNIFSDFATNVIFQLTEINNTEIIPHGQDSHQGLLHLVGKCVPQLCSQPSHRPCHK